jgi:anthranilate synthase component 2
MRLLILDNYDSFTYNIVHAVKQLGYEPDVIRNNQIKIEEFDKYDKIIISPGPGIPSESGILPEFLKEYADKKSILGICLGHQAIGERFGATLLNLPQVYHGIQTPIKIIANDYIFNGLPAEINVGRYHSWVIDTKNFPNELEITALDSEDNIMAIRHKSLDIRGVQFHPESILTPDGVQILSNWLNH